MRFILCTGIALLGNLALVERSSSQPKQEGKQFTDIIRNFNERQGKVNSVKFEFSMEQTIYKGSSTAREPNAFEKDASHEPNPDRDYIVKGKGGVAIRGSQMRYWYDRPQWDPVGKKLYDESYVDAFDGKRFLRLFIPASGQAAYPLAQIRAVSESESAIQFPIAPIFLTFRGTQKQFRQSIDDYKLSNRITNVGSRPCVELIHGAASAQQQDVLYLDQERGYIVRKAVLFNGQPLWQLDITYQPDAVVGWVPKSWEYLIRLSSEAQPNESARYTVTKYEINPSLEDSDFTLTFPPRSRVLDHSSGKQIQYVIQEGGEKGRAIPLDQNPTYDELNQPAPRFSRHLLLVVWGATLALAVGGFFWLRYWRKHKAVPPATHG